jgi:hypothetical protein
MMLQVLQHAVHLLLLGHNCCEGFESYGSLVQPAVGPGSAEQAALVFGTELHHQQQAGVRQVQQGWCNSL